MTEGPPPRESEEWGTPWTRGDWGENASLQGWSALGLGCLAVFAGLVQAWLDGLFPLRLDFPLLSALMGVPPIALGLMAISDSERRPRSEFLLRHAGTLSLLFLAAVLVARVLLERGR